MKSIKFPHMFEANSTAIVKDLDASKQNLTLVLASEQGEMFGDPSFGVSIRKYFYEQNGFILEDLIIDEIYTAIKFFAPQIIVDRKDIKIERVKDKLIANITGINQKDFVTNTYELVLFQEEER